MTEDVIARYILDLKDLKGKVSELEKQFGKVDGAAEKSASKVGAAFTKAGETAKDGLKGIAEGIVAAFAVREVIAFGKEAVHAFEEAQKSASQLQSALSANGGIQADFDKLIQQSAELQEKTIFSDEQIQNAQKAAAQYGLSASAIEKLIPIVADFASATGQDLNSALETVIQGINGNARSLKIYGVEIDTGATKTARFASIQEQLTKKFQGQAEVLGRTSQGAIKRLGNAFDDLKENIGKALLPIVEASAGVAKAFVDMASTPLSEKLRDEQKEFGATRIQLLGLNEGSQERVKIIKELQAKYPDYLGNINAEKVSNEELFKALDKINNSLIFRIAVQRTQESLNKQAEQTGKALNDQAEARGKLLETFDRILGSNNSAQKKYNENLIKGLPFELAIKEVLNNKIKLNGVSAVTLAKLGDEYEAYEKTVVAASAEQVKFNDLQLEVKKRQEDIRELIGAPVESTKATGLESLLDGINLAKISMKELIALRDKLLTRNDETSKSQLDQVTKEIEARTKALQDAEKNRLDLEKKNADLRESLRKKELDQDIENIEVKLAEDKKAIAESSLSEFGKSVAVAKVEKKALEDRALAYKQYGENVGGVLNQIVDKTNELNKLVAKGAGEIHPNREDFEASNKAIAEGDDQLLKQKQESNKILRDQAIQAAQSIADSIFEINRNANDAQIAEIERVKEAEFRALDDTLAANQRNFDDRLIGAKEFRDTEKKLQEKKQAADDAARKKENEIRRKQDAAEKEQKLFSIILSTATGIMNIWSQFGAYPPVAAALTALLAGIAAAQTAAVLSAPVPKYYKGTRYVDEQGMYPSGIDTVDAKLTKGERVITVDDNKKNWHLYEAIRTKQFDKYINKVYVVPALSKAIETGKIREQKSFAENVAYSLMMNEDSLAKKIAFEMAKEADWRTRKGQKVIGMDQLIDTIKQTTKPQYRKN